MQALFNFLDFFPNFLYTEEQGIDNLIKIETFPVRVKIYYQPGVLHYEAGFAFFS